MFLNTETCLVCVCLILKKKLTPVRNINFLIQEREYILFPLLLCVCSFLFLLFSFSSLRAENETHAPHLHRHNPLIHGWASCSSDLLSTFSTPRPSNESFLMSPLTHHSKVQVRIWLSPCLAMVFCLETEFDFKAEGFWLAPKLCRWGWDLYED